MVPTQTKVTEHALNVRLPASLHQAVRVFALERHMSIASVFRWAVSEHLKRYGQGESEPRSNRRASTARKR